MASSSEGIPSTAGRQKPPDDNEQNLYTIGRVEDLDTNATPPINLLEEALKQSEEQFRAVFMNSVLGMAFVNQEGHFLRMNGTFCEIAGYSKEVCEQRGLAELIHPADRGEHERLFQELISGKCSSFTQQARYLHKNGAQLWARNTIFLSGGTKGGARLIVVFSENITEQKRREEERSRFAAIVYSSDDAIISTTEHGIITTWNKGAERIYQYTSEEIIGRPVSLLLPSGKEDEFPLIMNQLKQGKRIDHYETERRRKDGMIIQVSLTASPIKDTTGAITGASKVARDITEHVQMEEGKARLAAIIDSSDDAIISKTLDSIITSWNRAAEQMFGYTAEEAIGQSILLIIPPELHSEETEIIRKLRNGIRIHHYETVRMTKAGKRLDISLSISPIRDGTGKIVGAAKIARDITEKKAFENRKDEFIGMASHELKTPITSLKGFAHLLHRRLQHDNNGDALHFLSRMNSQIDKLTRLVSELLDISKMQNGQLKYQREPFDLALLTREIVENIQETTQTHRLIVEELASAQILGDKDRIGQAMTNLLTNAIKYSPNADRVLVRVRVDAEGEQVIFSVQDFGLGIARADQQKIFDRFYRTNDPQKQNFPGLGIGLYISREIIKRHGGTIQVESEEGKGSTFSCSIPLLQSV